MTRFLGLERRIAAGRIGSLSHDYSRRFAGLWLPSCRQRKPCYALALFVATLSTPNLEPC